MAADAPALPTLPHSVVHEICHYLWPADVARLADTCRSLGAKDEVSPVFGGDDGFGCSALIEHGLRMFRPTHALPAMTTYELICHRLPPLKGLRVLDFSSAIVSPAALYTMGQLAAEAGAFKSVRVLSFYDNEIWAYGASSLGEALLRGGFRDTLEGLYIRKNWICDDRDNEQLVVRYAPYLLFTALADGACQAPLRALCLAQTGLDDKAAKHLGRALASPYLKHLKKLDLHHNEIGDEGVVAIAEGLTEGGGMPCLDELYLGYNRIGECAGVMGGALRFMPALRELDLANNRIANIDIRPLILGLCRSSSSSEGEGDGEERAKHPMLALETMDLRGNRITELGAMHMLNILTDPVTNETRMPLLCPRLASIYLDDNLAVRAPAGRAALQRLRAVTGIAWAYAEVW